MRRCRWSWAQIAQTQRISTTRTSWRYTNPPWTCTDWFTQDSYWRHGAWQWWRKSTCSVLSVIAQECCASDTMCCQSECRRSSQLRESRSTARDARTYTFRGKNNLTSTVLTLEPASRTYSWNSSQNFCQKAQPSSFLRSMDSKYLACEDQNTSSNLITKASPWTKTRFDLSWRKEQRMVRDKFWLA